MFCVECGLVPCRDMCNKEARRKVSEKFRVVVVEKNGENQMDEQRKP